ncbi:hypothetical protein, partial [Mycobacterium sp.]|uniref:hypothetical protein n=1 Tax=Mycobacterium sp. TaxID=1785 RepID=UPI003A84501F
MGDRPDAVFQAPRAPKQRARQEAGAQRAQRERAPMQRAQRAAGVRRVQRAQRAARVRRATGQRARATPEQP